ncbi:glutathione S-transferase family protein [Bosea vaviloviae]|uniref:Glutathione S-transferase n=1 Tax=Bosea vaviloviae TaxID=1526658 RepID=A0A1D7TXY0_9HYPH|nr:glutathione S-transferase family protein [Bosea vaviloviae]AOO79984.1 glutathione S-transferase [Bosea vaviloviae]
MSLMLHFHPLSSFCQKVLIALYESGTPFTPKLVDLSDANQRAAFLTLWPIGKFPVLEDLDKGRVVPESSLIIEFLDQNYPGRNYPGASPFIPHEPAAALEVRHWDRFFDLNVNEPVQKIVGDRLRPDGQHDPAGVAHARGRLKTACGMLETALVDRRWAAGAAFSMADCAAAPALFYADKVMPFGADYPVTSAYVERLRARPSYARVLAEAQPYLAMFPQARD